MRQNSPAILPGNGNRSHTANDEIGPNPADTSKSAFLRGQISPFSRAGRVPQKRKTKNASRLPRKTFFISNESNGLVVFRRSCRSFFSRNSRLLGGAEIGSYRIRIDGHSVIDLFFDFRLRGMLRAGNESGNNNT